MQRRSGTGNPLSVSRMPSAGSGCVWARVSSNISIMRRRCGTYWRPGTRNSARAMQPAGPCYCRQIGSTARAPPPAWRWNLCLGTCGLDDVSSDVRHPALLIYSTDEHWSLQMSLLRTANASEYHFHINLISHRLPSTRHSNLYCWLEPHFRESSLINRITFMVLKHDCIT